MFYTILWWICYLLFKILFCYKIYGKENLLSSGPYIIASNHLSYLDPIAIGLLVRKKLNFLAREDLFRNRIFGFLIKSLGAIPLDPEGRDVRALRRGIRILKNKGILVIFPEGKRSLNGELGKFLPGVGFLVKMVSAPVVPIYIHGTDSALPVRAYFIRLKKIQTYIGKPLFPYNRSIEEIKELLWREINFLREKAKLVD